MEVCHYCGRIKYHISQLFYLAMSQEPDYMPSAQRKAQQEKALAQHEHASAASEVIKQNPQK